MYFAAVWDSPIKCQAKNITHSPVYLFWQFIATVNYKKSMIVINAYELTANKNPILTIFNYKQSIIVINAYELTANKNPILTIFSNKKAP